MSDRETELKEARQARARLQADQTAVAAERKSLERENAVLTERVREFEMRQRQFKEQMQKLLAVS
jgi:chromosome segregation ATPase